MQTTTLPGSDLLVLAGWLADELAARPRDERAPELLWDSGYPAAPVPEALGGLGVWSVHDLVLAAGRLARTDAVLATAVAGHWAALLRLGRDGGAAAAATARDWIDPPAGDPVAAMLASAAALGGAEAALGASGRDARLDLDTAHAVLAGAAALVDGGGSAQAAADAACSFASDAIARAAAAALEAT